MFSQSRVSRQAKNDLSRTFYGISTLTQIACGVSEQRLGTANRAGKRVGVLGQRDVEREESRDRSKPVMAETSRGPSRNEWWETRIPPRNHVCEAPSAHVHDSSSVCASPPSTSWVNRGPFPTSVMTPMEIRSGHSPSMRLAKKTFGLSLRSRIRARWVCSLTKNLHTQVCQRPLSNHAVSNKMLVSRDVSRHGSLTHALQRGSGHLVSHRIGRESDRKMAMSPCVARHQRDFVVRSCISRHVNIRHANILDPYVNELPDLNSPRDLVRR